MRKRMIRLVVLLVFLNWLPTHAQLPISTLREETAVRTAYARLSFATEVDAVTSLASVPLVKGKPELDLARRTLRFEVTRVKTGNIEEILDTTYGTLFTPPTGDILDTSLSGHRAITENNEEVIQQGASARWRTVSETSLTELTIPLRQTIQLANVRGIRHYALCDITAFLDGRTRSYTALWLFGEDHTTPLVIVDAITGAILRTLLTVSVYPHVLLETPIRDKPVVTQWIAAHQVSQSTCTADQTSACCDTAQMRCGLLPDDVTASLSHPPTHNASFP